MPQNDELTDPVQCPRCGAYLDLTDAIDGKLECSSCGESIVVEEDGSYEPELLRPEVVPSVPRKKRRGGWKNFFAIIIGMLGGLVVRMVVGIPLSILFSTEQGLPEDIRLLLELFTAFIAGALAASLVPRLGWLFGMLTQALKLVLTVFVLGLWAYLAATDPDVDFHLLDPLPARVMRIMFFSIACAAFAGGVAEKYREKILSFLGSTFGMIAGSFGCLLHALFGLFELYFLYLGGKAIFEDGKILKGLAIVILVGPIASYAIGAVLIGLVMGVFWIFSKVYNVYAEDLGLDTM